MRSVAFTARAARQMAKLPADIRKQINDKLDRYARTGAGDVKALVGILGNRLRVGDYRIIFVETATMIEVEAVANRRDIYR